jgi:hypothetical protein
MDFSSSAEILSSFIQQYPAQWIYWGNIHKMIVPPDTEIK